MNSTHNTGENGRPLEEDLDRISQAYSQLDGEEPPELLDLAIRNSAHRAVEKKPRRMKFSWLHGLTTAAVFVLALSVIIHQHENQPAVGEGLQFDRTQPGPAANPAEKRSSATRAGQVHSELEEAADTGQVPTGVSAVAPVGEPKDQALGDTLRDSRQKASTATIQQSDTTSTDEDQFVLEKTIEAKEEDKRTPESMAITTEDAERTSAAPSPAGTEAKSDSDLQAEKQLQAIISMKREGNEHWKAALKTFIENHPGYPLPDELKD